jgi:archaellum component FlaC
MVLAEMNKKQLKKEYLKRMKRYQLMADSLNCGNALMEFIKPQAKEAREAVEEIETEVRRRILAGA